MQRKWLIYRNRNTAVTATAATSKTAAITYLLAENQDCEFPIPALKTKSEDRVPKDSSAGFDCAGCIGGFAGRTADEAGAVPPFTCAGVTATVPAAAWDTTRVIGTATLAADCAAANARPSLGSATGAAAAAVAACRAPPPWGTRSCPRHFFSSHSTQSTRPAEIGKPQASHLRSPRNPGGTWLRSASSGAACSAAGFGAADQNTGFLVGIVSDGAGRICAAGDAGSEVVSGVIDFGASVVAATFS